MNPFGNLFFKSVLDGEQDPGDPNEEMQMKKEEMDNIIKEDQEVNKEGLVYKTANKFISRRSSFKKFRSSL